MSVRNWLRGLFASPSHVDARDDAAEVDATLSEEYAAPDPAEADVTRMAETGGLVGSYGRAEAAEAAEEDLETEEAPPDPDP